MSAERNAFLIVLRSGVRDLPREVVREILEDYERYFAEGTARGRTDEEICRALGDPIDLANQLRMEAQIARWEQNASPRTAVRLIASATLAGMLDLGFVLILAPVAALVAVMLLTIIVAFLFAGFWIVFSGTSLPGGQLTAALCGAGSIFAAIAMLSFELLGARALMHMLARHLRNRFRPTADCKQKEVAA
jgi:uncharacterized membrane protein